MPIEAVIRETYEETGLNVEVVRHIADMNQPQINRVLHLFECRIVSGELIKENREVVVGSTCLLMSVLY